MRMAERRNAAAAPSDLLAGRREQQASDRGTPEDAKALDGARGDVGGGELLRRLCNGGRSAACAGRTAEYAMATSPRGRRRGRAVLHDDDRRRRREEDGRESSATTITRSRRYRSPSKAVNGEATADGRNPRVRRARRRRRRRPGTRTPPARCRTPSAPDRSRPRALDPPDIGVPEDLAEGARRVLDVPAARSRGKHPTTRCVFRMEGGRFLCPPPSSG